MWLTLSDSGPTNWIGPVKWRARSYEHLSALCCSFVVQQCKIGVPGLMYWFVRAHSSRMDAKLLNGAAADSSPQIRSRLVGYKQTRTKKHLQLKTTHSLYNIYLNKQRRGTGQSKVHFIYQGKLWTVIYSKRHQRDSVLKFPTFKLHHCLFNDRLELTCVEWINI